MSNSSVSSIEQARAQYDEAVMNFDTVTSYGPTARESIDAARVDVQEKWNTLLAAVRSAPQDSPDLTIPLIPRYIELLEQAGVTEPDILKHMLEDWKRWRKEVVELEIGNADLRRQLEAVSVSPPAAGENVGRTPEWRENAFAGEKDGNQ